MSHRPLLRFAALLAALAFLLPMAALGGLCGDCLGGDSPGCCPPVCCPCCVHAPSILTAAIGSAAYAGTVDVVPSPLEPLALSSPPHDIFHVPKPVLSLA